MVIQFLLNLFLNIVRSLLWSLFYRSGNCIHREHITCPRDHGSWVGEPGSESVSEWPQSLSFPNLSVTFTIYWWLWVNVRATFRTREMSASPYQAIHTFPLHINQITKIIHIKKEDRNYGKTRAHHVLGMWPRAAYTPSQMTGMQNSAKLSTFSFWEKAKLWRQ